MSPALSITDNMFMGRESAQAGLHGRLGSAPARPQGDGEAFARDKLTELGLMTIQNINQAVETLSGGQRQGVAVARAAAFGSKVIILDEPTAALGVKESRRVLELILDVRSRGIPIILISHNMPHVFEVADRIHVHRLGKRLCVINPKDYTMSDAVAFMTGAKEPPRDGFHLDNAVLEARGTLARKGAPFTFDADGYAVLLERLRKTPAAEVAVPVFDRVLDLARAGGRIIAPEHRFLIAEGNYLLLDEEPWVHLADMFDLTVMLKADPGELRRRLVDRWLAHGLDPDQALARALSNDIPNAELVVRDSRKADLEIAG
jgi:energy-coupling factor transporter ATP-binding protein EcfA2